MSLTNYPSALDDETSIPTAVNNVTPINALVVNRLREALVAIERELGANPSGVFGTVKDRLEAIRGVENSFQSQIDDINNELGTNPSGTFSTVAGRFSSVDNRLSSLESFAQANIPLALSAEVSIDTYTAIGGDEFNPQDFEAPSGLSRIITFVARIYTTNVSVPAHVRLFNVTDGVSVADTEVSSSSLSPDRKEIILTVPDDLPNSQKTYEVQLKMDSASTGDSAFCQKAELEVVFQ